MGNKCNIECEWMRSKRLIVNPDGQVVPCCFFANALFVSKQHGYPQKFDKSNYKFELKDELTLYAFTSTETTADPILNSYIKQEDELNAYNTPLHEILDHNWYHELYASWDDEDKVSPICVRNCSK